MSAFFQRAQPFLLVLTGLGGAVYSASTFLMKPLITKLEATEEKMITKLEATEKTLRTEIKATEKTLQTEIKATEKTLLSEIRTHPDTVSEH